MASDVRTAVILAGGVGKRLRPYTLTIPKPLLPLNGTPILEIVLSQLASDGFNRVVLCLGHLGRMVEYWIDRPNRWRMNVEFVYEDEPLGTAGALRIVDDLPESFLVMNGDLLTTMSYSSFLQEMHESNHVACVALSRREIDVDYGVVDLTDAGHIGAYQEKPRIPILVSTGIYAIRRSALELLPPGYVDMPTLLESLMSAGHPVRGVPVDCYWQDIGRVDDFARADEDFTANPERFVMDWRGAS